MIEMETLHTGEGSASEETEIEGRPSLPDERERRLPFTVRVAVEWLTVDDLQGPEDGELGYWQRAPMTGKVVTTSGGQDISFSDLEVT